MTEFKKATITGPALVGIREENNNEIKEVTRGTLKQNLVNILIVGQEGTAISELLAKFGAEPLDERAPSMVQLNNDYRVSEIVLEHETDKYN